VSRGIGAADLITFGVITGLLTATAFVACYVPARRASRIDPLLALCEEQPGCSPTGERQSAPADQTPGEANVLCDPLQAWKPARRADADRRQGSRGRPA
jgi:hypothetical protein